MKIKIPHGLIKKLAIPVLALGIGNASHAQIKGNIEMNTSKNSLVETNFFYRSDKLKTRGFTFMDYFFKNGGFFGKTILNTKLRKNTSLETQVYHINEPITKSGVGASYKIPINNINAKIGILPFWIDKKGNPIKNNINANYFFKVKLPKDFSFMTFGQFTINSKGGPRWGYGEIGLSKKFGKNKKWEISYNPSLEAQGKFSTRYYHRIALRRKF